MKPVIFGLAVVLLAACGRQQPNPEQAADYAAEAVRLFTQACAAHNGDTQQTAAWAAQHGLQPLDTTAVKQLPAGMMELEAQAVWQTERNGGVFYLSTGPASCSVKTAVADEAAARKAFALLAEGGETGAAAQLRFENSVSSPFPFRQLVYARLLPESGEEILLSANTSPSNLVPAQLVLHLARKPLDAASVISRP